MSITKSPVDVIDAAVNTISAQIANAKARRAMFKSGKTRTMLVNLMTPLMYAVGKIGNVSILDFCDKPAIHISMFGLDSFKQYELVAALEYLTAETEKLNGTMTTEDWAAAVNRDFKFKTDKWEVSINAYVKDDSQTCRKIVVGTEMVERHKYQIVCD